MSEYVVFTLVRGKTPIRRQERWHFRIVSSNGRILAHSEKYHNRQDAVDAINLIIGGIDPDGMEILEVEA